MMTEIPFTLRLITPAFVGGAPCGEKSIRHLSEGEEIQCSPPYYPIDRRGIRIPSLRGVLEFWHRSRWGNLAGEAVFAQQARVFGSTGFGQGLSLRPLGEPKFKSGVLRFKRSERNFYAVLYLGYGPLQLLQVPGNGREVTSHHHLSCRDAILIEGGADPTFRFCARGTETQVRELRRALELLHLFGGIGARSRRGWGSVAVEIDGEPANPPPVAAERVKGWFEERIALALGESWRTAGKRVARPLFTAFSGSSRALLTRVFPDHLSVLREFFDQFQTVRSVQGKSPIAASDKAIEKTDATGPGGALRAVPQRLAFGLPYHPQQRGRWEIDYRGRHRGADETDDVTRRASPLLLKVFRLAADKYVGVALFLESSFFGDPKRVIGAKGMPKTQPFPEYGAVTALLDGSGWTKLSLP